jgi:dTDP-4-dehydrorhamnose reductase
MRIFLTGGTGFLGSNIIRVAREVHGAAVFTTVHRWQPAQPVDFACAPLDLSDAPAVEAAVRAFAPDVVVHSAIWNDLPGLYRDRRAAWDAYVTATRALCDAANGVGARFILVSTDWVFDGTQADADEATPPNPVNYYGVLKALCERVALERARRGTVARVAGVNGVHWLRREAPEQNAGYGHLAGAAARALAAHGRFTVWQGPGTNARATPSLASECAAIIVRLAERDLGGIFHCVGGEAIDRLALARLTAEVFGCDPASVETGPPPDDDIARMAIPIPRDTSLNGAATARALDHPLLPARAWLLRYKRQLETGDLT